MTVAPMYALDDTVEIPVVRAPVTAMTHAGPGGMWWEMQAVAALLDGDVGRLCWLVRLAEAEPLS